MKNFAYLVAAVTMAAAVLGCGSSTDDKTPAGQTAAQPGGTNGVTPPAKKAGAPGTGGGIIGHPVSGPGNQDLGAGSKMKGRG